MTKIFVVGMIFLVQLNAIAQSEITLDSLLRILVPPGTIVAYAGEDPPVGWLLCNGEQMNRDKYPELFDAIGVAWGEGRRPNTFLLPDLRGRFLRGVDRDAGRDPDRDTRKESGYNGYGGNRVGSIQDDELKSHTHNVNDPGHTHSYSSRGSAAANNEGVGDIRFLTINSDKSLFGLNNTFPRSQGIEETETRISISTFGGFETRPKNVYVNFIIKY